MSDESILVVDDEEDIRLLLTELLRRHGYAVREAPSGQEALVQLFATPPSLVLLDVAMPELDGWATLARIREVSDVPVIMVTARGEELERVRGLQSGADDYVTKPFGRQELLARVEALLRRTAIPGEPLLPRETYQGDFVTIEVANALLRVVGHEVSLTPLEFRLLYAFLRNPPPVLRRR